MYQERLHGLSTAAVFLAPTFFNMGVFLYCVIG